MKRKTCFIFTLLIGIVSFNGMIYGKDTSNKWQGHLDTKNGITIVKNTDKPLFGHIILEIKEDLVLTYGKDENDVFGSQLGIELDQEENIYLLDFQQFRGLSFDKNGKYRFQFGGKGAGPGQLSNPHDFFVGKNSNIHILDNRIIHTMDHSGEPIGQIKLNQLGLEFFLTDKKHYILSYYFFDNNGASKEQIVGYSATPLKIEKELAKYLLDKVVKEKIGQGYMFYILKHHYKPEFCFARSIDNKCVFGFPNKYTLNVVDGDGNIVMIIENAEKAVDISSKEKQTIEDIIAPAYQEWPKKVFKEALQFPSQRPFFRKIIVDNMGVIFVERVRPVLEYKKGEKKTYLYDVYNKEGYFIYNVQFPVRPVSIKNGCLFYVDSTSDEDEIAVKRYKITNWQDLKLYYAN